ncbi:MAG TPA: hypothetical protein VFD39_14615 [Trueperaceae bacterium]|nr:hypothetical protein [Trueperaceae bacterium]
MFSRVRLLLSISIGLLVLAACGAPVPPATGFDLSVSVVGDGAVTSDPAGIDTAAGTASANFAEGDVVTLTAAPTGTATFVNWTDGPCDASTDPACAVEMTADTAVTANFTEAAEPGEDVTFTVNVVNEGGAVGTVSSDVGGVTDCADSCEVTAAENTQVVLTATATTGGFAGWTGGDCDGQNTATCTVTVNAAEEAITANFNNVVTTTETVDISQVVEQLVNASSVDPILYPAGHNYTDSSDLDFGYDPTHSTQQWIGLRFDTALPAGANIQSAVITMTADEGAADAVTVTLSGEAVAAPAPFADDPNNTGSADASTRAGANGTTATVDWAITDPWAAGDAVTTPDLAAIVQEIVDVAGWGGSLVLFASPDAAAGTATRPVVNVLDTGSGTLEITIEYVAPPAAPASN